MLNGSMLLWYVALIAAGGVVFIAIEQKKQDKRHAGTRSIRTTCHMI